MYIKYFSSANPIQFVYIFIYIYMYVYMYMCVYNACSLKICTNRYIRRALDRPTERTQHLNKSSLHRASFQLVSPSILASVMHTRALVHGVAS